MGDEMEEAGAIRRNGGRHGRTAEDDVYSLDGEEDFDQVEEELEADRRDEATEEMASWFARHFEDPRRRTPWDVECDRHYFIWGGPFDAREMLDGEFGERHSSEWIAETVERIEDGEVYEWAPSTSGDYFDEPQAVAEAALLDDDDPASRREAAAGVLDRLERIEALLTELRAAPPASGHNRGPDRAGPPPLDEVVEREVRSAIEVVRRELASGSPSSADLARSESVLRRVGVAMAKWVGRKVDLAVDEGIKQGVQLVKWKVLAGLMIGAAGGIVHYTGLPV